MSEDRENEILNLMEEAAKRGKILPNAKDSGVTQKIKGSGNRQTVRAKKTASISQTTQGDGNVQQVIITEKAPRVNYLPPPDTIGADGFLKQRITELVNKIAEARKKTRGYSNAYAVVWKMLARDFGIKSNRPAMEIWRLPKEAAPEIIAYLEGKCARTIPGRMETNSKREGYVPTRPRLYEKEKRLLEHFGLKMSSPQVKELLLRNFGVESHSELTFIQHFQWVSHLEHEVKKLEE